MEDMDSWYNTPNKLVLGYNSAYMVVTYINDVGHDHTFRSMVDNGSKMC